MLCLCGPHLLPLPGQSKGEPHSPEKQESRHSCWLCPTWPKHMPVYSVMQSRTLLYLGGVLQGEELDSGICQAFLALAPAVVCLE